MLQEHCCKLWGNAAGTLQAWHTYHKALPAAAAGLASLQLLYVARSITGSNVRLFGQASRVIVRHACMQVAAAEQQCASRAEQCLNLQRDLQAAEVATADATTKLANTTAFAAEQQKQLTVAMQQRDHYSQLANDR